MSDDERRQRTLDQYRALMGNIRARFEIVDQLRLNEASAYTEVETAAFHLRKSIEGVAFGCLVAMENGLKAIPRDAQGQWNADRILVKLGKRSPPVFPFSCKREEPKPSHGKVQHHIVSNDADNLSIHDVRAAYRRTHRWLHEMNPYVPITEQKFVLLKNQLLQDLRAVWKWLLHHLIAANGEIFLAIMKNAQGEVEVVAATSKMAEG